MLNVTTEIYLNGEEKTTFPDICYGSLEVIILWKYAKGKWIMFFQCNDYSVER